jgi:hypothetical protein
VKIPGYAISGRAGAGKSTLCRNLIDELTVRGVPAVRVSFGDALKQEVYDRYGVSKDDPGGRELLVSHGETMRRRDPLHWVRPFAERAVMEMRLGYLVVCDDLRFLSELGWVHAAGFNLVRLEVPAHICAARIAQPPDPRSPGERELSAWGRWHHVFDECFGPLNLGAVAEYLAERAAAPVAA